jgi:hypothetical protein
VWQNDVDETNCDGYGKVEMSYLQVTPEEVQQCNLGHWHPVKPPTYRIPGIHESEFLKTYRESDTGIERWLQSDEVVEEKEMTAIIILSKPIPPVRHSSHKPRVD